MKPDMEVAVSYTHLDVYKRQLLLRVIQWYTEDVVELHGIVFRVIQTTSRVWVA